MDDGTLIRFGAPGAVDDVADEPGARCLEWGMPLAPLATLPLFTSTRNGATDIYIPDLKPLFTSTRNGATDINIPDLNGDNITRLTTTGGAHPMWSR